MTFEDSIVGDKLVTNLIRFYNPYYVWILEKSIYYANFLLD